MTVAPPMGSIQARRRYTPVAGYTLRLQADVEIDPAGGPVSTWGNTGTTVDVTQATSGARPTLDGGGVLFDGTDDVLASGPTWGNVIDADGFALFCAFTPIAWSTTSNLGSAHLNHGIVGEPGAYLGLSMRNVAGSEIMCWIADGVYKGVTLPGTLGAKHVVCFRYDGTNIYGSVNGGTEVSAACGNVGAAGLAQLVRLGRGYTAYANVRIFEVLAYDSSLSAPDVAANIAGLKADWGVA